MEYSSSRKKNFYENDIEQYQQQQNDELLISTFNKLYHSLVPSCPINYALPQKFQNLLKRILSTNFSVMKNDESVIVNSLLDKISKTSNFNQDTINKFQYLYSKLIKKRTLTKRWGILYILNSLSKNNLKNIDFIATNELQQNYLNSSMNMNTLNINQNIASNNMLIEKEFQYGNSNSKYNGNNMLNLNNSKYFNNLSPVSNVNERFYDNQDLSNINANNQEIKYVINPNKTSLRITEKDIINDLLFVFEGINGKYIAYDAAEDSYILNKLIPWSEEIINIVNTLCEIGWLYKKIKLYLDYFKESNIQSQFIKSFIYSIQSELNEYFKLISFLRKFNLNQIQIINNNQNKRSQNLNLKSLLLWTKLPKETLKWIAACCESIHSLKGTSVLSQIYSFVHYGGCGKYLNNILNEVSKPFINFVVNWIKYGELQDNYKEFFVDIITEIKDDDIWNLQYQLIGKNVPNFMKREPTIKIFEVGKCIHFIKNHCKENYNLSNLKSILIDLINKYSRYKYKDKVKDENKADKSFRMNIDNEMDLEENDNNMNSIIIKDDEQINNNNINRNNNRNNLNNYDFDYGFDDDKIVFEIESYQSCLEFIEYLFDPSKQDEILNMSFINEIIFNIDVIHKLINKDLVRIIFTKFKFISNLDSINKFLLLGQGDMMQSLMESLFEELDKPANLIFKHNLQSNLESAIRASNAQYNDEECLKKLNIKLNSASVGDIGWDIFCLEYKVDLPLSIIFNTKLLKDYQKLFFFFWKIKRIEYSQNNHIWKKVRILNQLLKNKEDFMKKSIQISIRFNQEIVHFITNLHNYLALKVLEAQYKKLLEEIPKVNNLNELIVKHRNFVDMVKKQCLLDEQNIGINKKIVNIFDIILKFRTIFDFLYNFLAEQFFENSSKNFSGGNSFGAQNRLKNIKEYLQQISILYKDFQNQIIELINTITLIGKNDLDFLKIKLDFNYFYSNLEKEEEERKNIEAINRINAEEERRKILEESHNENNDSKTDNFNASNNKYNHSNNNNNNIDNDEEGKENIEDEEMDVDENNNQLNINNSNNEQNLHLSNNDYNSNNNNYQNSYNNMLNTLDNRNYIDNNINNMPNTLDKKNYLDNNINNMKNTYGKSSTYNNFYDLNDNTNNAISINKINSISNMKTSKDNIIKIATKKKDNKPREIINELNDISDFNNQYNINNSNNLIGDNNINDSNNDFNNKLTRDDLEDNSMNNNIYKTQIEHKKYLYQKNNMDGLGQNLEYKSMTKYKPESNINLNRENADDEDQITTHVKPQYGFTTRARNKRDEEDDK